MSASGRRDREGAVPHPNPSTPTRNHTHTHTHTHTLDGRSGETSPVMERWARRSASKRRSSLIVGEDEFSSLAYSKRLATFQPRDSSSPSPTPAATRPSAADTKENVYPRRKAKGKAKGKGKTKGKGKRKGYPQRERNDRDKAQDRLYRRKSYGRLVKSKSKARLGRTGTARYAPKEHGDDRDKEVGSRGRTGAAPSKVIMMHNGDHRRAQDSSAQAAAGVEAEREAEAAARRELRMIEEAEAEEVRKAERMARIRAFTVDLARKEAERAEKSLAAKKAAKEKRLLESTVAVLMHKAETQQEVSDSQKMRVLERIRTRMRERAQAMRKRRRELAQAEAERAREAAAEQARRHEVLERQRAKHAAKRELEERMEEETRSMAEAKMLETIEAQKKQTREMLRMRNLMLELLDATYDLRQELDQAAEGHAGNGAPFDWDAVIERLAQRQLLVDRRRGQIEKLEAQLDTARYQERVWSALDREMLIADAKQDLEALLRQCGMEEEDWVYGEASGSEEEDRCESSSEYDEDEDEDDSGGGGGGGDGDGGGGGGGGGGGDGDGARGGRSGARSGARGGRSGGDASGGGRRPTSAAQFTALTNVFLQSISAPSLRQ